MSSPHQQQQQEMDVETIVDCSDANFVYIDILGFKTYKNRFICKELCLKHNDYVYHTLMKSPYIFNKVPRKYQIQAHWMTNYFHGLSYDSGETHPIELKQRIFPIVQNKIVLVTSEDKKIWLEYFFRECGPINCVSLDSLGYHSNFQSKIVCEYHHKIIGFKGECAMFTALKLKAIVQCNSRLKSKINKKIHKFRQLRLL